MRRQSGSLTITSWIGDHEPPHVHVYRDGLLVAKFNTRDKVFMMLRAGYKGRVVKALKKANLL